MAWKHVPGDWMDTWINTNHPIVIKYHIMASHKAPDGKYDVVTLGQGRGYSYSLIEEKRFSNQNKALDLVKKLKRKYNNGWM